MSAAGAGPCDHGVATGAAAPADGRRTAHPSGTLAATILGSSLAFIDGSVVNVGLPAIERDLASSGASGASIGWLVNAYLLPLGALVLFGGVAGDRYGRRRMFLGGMALFTAASLACALAPGFGWLVAARTAQGVGAAFLMPASLALIGAAFEGEARGRAVGTWAAAGAVTSALGPLAGGWLIDAVGWRAIFLVNLPIAALAAWLALRKVGESRSASAAPLDVAGALLATLGLAALTLGLTLLASRGEAPAGGGTATALSCIAIGGAALAAFIGLKSRLGDRAMLPLALFSTPGFIGVSLLTLFLYAALGGMMVLLPWLLISNGGYSAAQAGAGLLPLPVAMGLGSRAAGRLAERLGPRLLLTIGPCIVAAGFALFLRIDGSAVRYVGAVLPALAVLACGLTLSVAPLTAAVMGSVDAGHVGSASGVNNAVARVAGLIATALLGFVLAGDAKGAAFIGRFHAAALIGCVLALLAGGCALACLKPGAAAPAGRPSTRRAG